MLLGISPVINVGAFWIVRVTDPRFAVIPVLGIVAICQGGLLALGFSRLFRHSRAKTGAMFTSGSFTNLGTFGGLVSFAFFGEASYAVVSMYRLFEDFAYFGVGYPIARLYSDTGSAATDTNLIQRLAQDPFIRAYSLSMLVGVCLNFSGIPRPALFGALNSFLIPLTSFILVTTVGFRMRFGAVRNYLGEAFAIGLIKFVAIPLTIVPAAIGLGVGNLLDGMALRVVFILACMPPAFNSLIPPQIYDLDVDLANSSWLLNLAALIIVLPLLYLPQQWL